MRILIVGAKGMLGQDVAKVLDSHDLVLWDRDEIDITNQVEVEAKIPELKPDLVINCAAYTAVDQAEEDFQAAEAVNGYGVGNIGRAVKIIDIPIVHISTDYVFNGQIKEGYKEDSQDFGPESVYGKTKLLGEKLLQEYTDKFYLIRTSWLFGKQGPNFVETMLKLGAERDTLKVVNDQFGKPTYTVDLAEMIKTIIEDQLDYGIYHVTNKTKEGGISWYEFAQEIFKISKIEVKVEPCTTEEFPRPAKRPKYSALINTKLNKTRDWKEALIEYLNISI